MTGRRLGALAVTLLLVVGACDGDAGGGSEYNQRRSDPELRRALVIGDSNLFQSAEQVDAALRDVGIEPTLHGVPGYGVKELEYWLGQLDELLVQDPDVVVVGLGTNDALAQGDVLAFPARLDQMMDELGDVPVIWLTHVDDRPGAVAAAGRTINQMIREAAARWPNLTVLDFATAIAADPGILHSDALHFSPRGMQVYAQAIADVTQEVLGTLTLG